MAAFAAAFQSLARRIAPPAAPDRLLAVRRVRLFAAAVRGSRERLAFLLAYYATLGLLPSAFAYPATEYPVSAWAHRLDLAQFVGTLLYPPLPSPLTWWLGLAVLFGNLHGLRRRLCRPAGLDIADVRCRQRAWASARRSFVGLALTLTIANGLHPAIMRNTLPDTGVFLIGWSSLATLQLLLVHLLYGATVWAPFIGALTLRR